MKPRLVVFLGLALATASMSLGCAGEAGGDPAAGPGEEEDLTKTQLPGVVAIEIAEVHGQTTVTSSVTVGAPKKVKSVMTSVRKLRPSEAVPKCMMIDTTRVTFFDASAKKIATIGTYCGGYG